MDDEFCEECHCKVTITYNGDQRKKLCRCEWHESKERDDLLTAIRSPFDWQEYREGEK